MTDVQVGPENSWETGACSIRSLHARPQSSAQFELLTKTELIGLLIIYFVYH
jgi:hypothetical protein